MIFGPKLRQLRKMGSLEGVLGHLPQAGPFKNLAGARMDEARLRHFRSHHRFDDGRGADRSEDDQRQPPGSHRPGQRPAGE